MAIARTSSLIGAASGALGPFVFANTQQGLLLKNRPLKTNQQTEKQLDARARFQTVVNFWSSIDADVYNEWRTAARHLSKANRLGVRSPLSPWTLFMRQNLWTLWTHGVLNTSPILNTQTYAVIDASITFTAGGAYLVAITNPTARPLLSVIYGARSFRTYARDKWTPKTWTFVQFLPFPLGVPLDVQSAWDNEIGAPQQNELVTVKIVLYPNLVYWPVGPPRTLTTQML